jgi:hypothetical protein
MALTLEQNTGRIKPLKQLKARAFPSDVAECCDIAGVVRRLNGGTIGDTMTDHYFMWSSVGCVDKNPPAGKNRVRLKRRNSLLSVSMTFLRMNSTLLSPRISHGVDHSDSCRTL